VELAGLLARLLFEAFPSRVRDSGRSFKKFVLRLTAAGTAPDLHRIPMFVLVDRKSISEPFPEAKVEIFTRDQTRKRRLKIIFHVGSYMPTTYAVHFLCEALQLRDFVAETKKTISFTTDYTEKHRLKYCRFICENRCYPWCKNIILTQISPTNTKQVKKFRKQVFVKSELVNILGFVPI